MCRLAGFQAERVNANILQFKRSTSAPPILVPETPAKSTCTSLQRGRTDLHQSGSDDIASLADNTVEKFEWVERHSKVI